MRCFLFRSTPIRRMFVLAVALTIGGCGGGGSGAPQLPTGLSNAAQGAAATASAPGAPALSSTNWRLQAGGDHRAGALQALAMLPSTITIDVGDSITWTIAGEVHTVTFHCCAGDPTVPQGGSTFNGSNFVSSGILAPGQQYTLTFTTAGHTTTDASCIRRR